MTDQIESLKIKHADEIARLRADEADDLSDELFQDFFDAYVNNGEMPYDVAKARLGDPYEWIYQRIV